MSNNQSYIIVSICCVTYNHAPFIRKALDGFLMQEPPFGVSADEPWYEILIHDDASTDGTTEIIKEYQAKYPDKIFPLFEEENQYSKGHVADMDMYNYRRVRGRYIAYCEGDDYWTDPLKLQKQVDFMDAHLDYSVCWHRVVVVDTYDKKIRDGRADRLFEQIPSVDGIDIDISKFFENWYTQPCSMMIRRDSLDYTWHTLYKTYCDTHEIYHLLKVGKGYILNFIGANYRMHSGGIASSMSTIRGCLSELGYIEELYYANRDIYTKNYWKSVLLWTIDTLKQSGEKQLIRDTLWREYKLFPLQTVRVIFILCKRSIKAHVREIIK